MLAGRMEKSTEIEGVIVEFYRVGNAVKVSAVDTRTFLEVSIVASPHCSEQEMTDTVLRKLAYVQEKKLGQEKSSGRKKSAGRKKARAGIKARAPGAAGGTLTGYLGAAG